MLNISPALLKDLQCQLSNYGYQLKHSVINNLNKTEENHRYIFDNGSIKLLVEFKK